MAADRNAEDIKNRFSVEQEYTQRYVDFLRAKSTITDRQLADLRSILRMYGLPLLYRRDSAAKGTFTDQNIVDLLESIKTITPAVQTAITRQASAVENFVDPPRPGPDVIVPETVGYLVEFFLEKMGRNGPPHLSNGDRNYIKSTLEDETGRDFSNESNKAGLDYAIACAVQECGVRKLDRLRHVLTRFGELDLLGRLLSSHAHVGVLRQGFLLLMMAFDAAVFDLVRVALRRKFFALIGAFGKQDKLSLHDIAGLGSFERLQEEIIEDQLKKRYVKDLLCLLANDWNVECTDAGDKFERLLEFVLRRNLHVHNRGIVDERYLGENKNLDRLKLGDVAVIDLTYWELANRLCGECVSRVAVWAGT